MFTIEVASPGATVRDTYEYAHEAWLAYAIQIEGAAESMADCLKYEETFVPRAVRMVYMIDVPGAEVEYAHVTIA